MEPKTARPSNLHPKPKTSKHFDKPRGCAASPHGQLPTDGDSASDLVVYKGGGFDKEVGFRVYGFMG